MVNGRQSDAFAAFSGNRVIKGEEKTFTVRQPFGGQDKHNAANRVETPLSSRKEALKY